MKQVLDYLNSFVTVILILAGLGGVSYNLFKEGGWLGVILGKWWSAQMAHPMIAIPVTIAVIVIGKLWIDHNKAKGHTSKVPDVMVYVIMAAGVFFIYRLIFEGTF
ncbi:MAG TPA: hypothetical protein VFO57_03325 [Burkholderiales bacterium]|nr:hypothetical protein [Burkholderiales bacterium]